MTQTFKTIQNKPMLDLRHAELKLSLSRLIANKSGLVGATITGTQQSGKSSYALCVLYELYQGDIDKVFKHIVFTVKDLTTLLNEALQKHERLTCVLWDDSSVHGSAGQYNINRRMVTYLSAMGDTLGLATKGIIMTSPSGDIIKAFRNYNFYRVQIGIPPNNARKYDRLAKGYEFGMSPFGQKWGRIAFEDNYDTRIPFYERYYKLREQLSLSTLKDMDSFINNTAEKEEPVEPKETIKDKALRLHRDWQAGVFDEVSFKDICKHNYINYDYANKVVSQEG